MKSLSLLFPDLDLNQYVVSDSKITVLESQDRKEVFHFFSPHQNEVLTIVYKEGTENGEAILDVDTLYQITWKIVDGKPKGEYRVHKFCVCRCIGYITEDGSFDKQCYIECSSKSTMDVHCDPTTGNIIYRGGMGKTRFERHGFGAVYDKVNGGPLYFGIFYHDRLYRMYQKFVNSDFMIEYAYDDDNELLNSNQEKITRYLDSHPAQPEGTVVYRGGFKTQPCLFFMRSGEGCEIRNGVTRYGIWKGMKCIEQWSTDFNNVTFDCLKGFVGKATKEELPMWKDNSEVVRVGREGSTQQNPLQSKTEQPAQNIPAKMNASKPAAFSNPFIPSSSVNLPSVSSNVLKSSSPSVSSNVSPPSSPIVSSNVSPPHPPSVSTNVSPPNPLSVSTNVLPPNLPSVSSNALPPNPLSVSTNVLPPNLPSVSSNALPPNPPSVSTNVSPPNPPSVSTNVLPPSSPTVSSNVSPPNPPSVSTNVPPPNPLSVSSNALPPNLPSVSSNISPPNPPSAFIPASIHASPNASLISNVSSVNSVPISTPTPTPTPITTIKPSSYSNSNSACFFSRPNSIASAPSFNSIAPMSSSSSQTGPSNPAPPMLSSKQSTESNPRSLTPSTEVVTSEEVNQQVNSSLPGLAKSTEHTSSLNLVNGSKRLSQESLDSYFSTSSQQNLPPPPPPPPSSSSSSFSGAPMTNEMYLPISLFYS